MFAGRQQRPIRRAVDTPADARTCRSRLLIVVVLAR
jgi:hypothetical protein